MDNTMTVENTEIIETNNDLPVNPEGPSIWGSIGWIVLFLVFQGAGMIAAIIFDGIMSGNGVALEPEKLNPIVLIFGILLGAAPLIALRAKYLCSMLNYKNDKNIWLISLAGVVAIFAGGWIYEALVVPGQPIQPESILFLRAMESGWMGIIITYLAAAVFAPILEEILFRGQLQGAITEKLQAKSIANGPIFAILITSAIFALIHMQPLAMPLLFLTGLVMGYIRYRTKSLVMPIAIHIVMNAIGITLILVTGEI